MPDETPEAWLARVPEWARGALYRRPAGEMALGGKGPGHIDWIGYGPGDDTATLDGCFTAAQLRDLADMMDPHGPAVLRIPPMSEQERAELLAAWRAAPTGPLMLVPDDPCDALGRVVIEAAREWAAATENDIVADETGAFGAPQVRAFNRVVDAVRNLGAAVRTYEAAGGADVDAQRTEGGHDGIRQG